MNFPGPKRPKSKSDMPRKAADQCAASGKCKIKNKQTSRLPKKSTPNDNDGDEQYTPPKFDSGGGGRKEFDRKKKAMYKPGGIVHKKGRGAECSEYRNR